MDGPAAAAAEDEEEEEEVVVVVVVEMSGGARSRIYASNLNYYSKSKDSDFTMFNIIVPN